MLSPSLKSAQEALDSFSSDVEMYSKQIENGVDNPALVAFNRIISGLSVNTDFYLDQRIARERQKK